MDSGEFMVIVAAVFLLVSLELSIGHRAPRTEKESHAGRPTFFFSASLCMFSYTEYILGVAGRVFGFANGALMSALRAGDSFDIFAAASSSEPILSRLSFIYKGQETKSEGRLTKSRSHKEWPRESLSEDVGDPSEWSFGIKKNHRLNHRLNHSASQPETIILPAK